MQYKLIIVTAFILIQTSAQEAVLAHYDLDGNLISDELTDINEINITSETSYNYDNVQTEEIIQSQQNSEGVIIKEDISFDQQPDNSLSADQSEDINNTRDTTDVNDIMSQSNSELTQEPVIQSSELVVNEQSIQNINEQLNTESVNTNVEDQPQTDYIVEYTNVSSNIQPIDEPLESTRSQQNQETQKTQESQDIQETQDTQGISSNMSRDALEEVVQQQLHDKEGISYLNLEAPKIIAQANCIIIYSQCQFKGEAMEVCDSLDQLDQFHHQILSLYVPEDQGLTIYEKENFEGKRQHFTQSQLCLKSGFQFIQIHQISQLSNNLRVRI